MNVTYSHALTERETSIFTSLRKEYSIAMHVSESFRKGLCYLLSINHPLLTFVSLDQSRNELLDKEHYAVVFGNVVHPSISCSAWADRETGKLTPATHYAAELGIED